MAVTKSRGIAWVRTGETPFQQFDPVISGHDMFDQKPGDGSGPINLDHGRATLLTLTR